MVKFAKQNKQMNFFKPVKITRDNSANKLNFPKHKLNVSPNVSLFSNVNTSIPKYSKPLQNKQQLKFKLQQKPLKAKQHIKQIKHGYISFGGKPVIVNTKENIRKIPKKELTYAQAKFRYPKLKSLDDNDRDGKLNMFDCKPFDKKRHGSFFDSDEFNKASFDDKLKAIRENRDEWKRYNRQEERRANKEAREMGYARGWKQMRDELKEDEKEKEKSAEDLVKETPAEEFTKEERADLNVSKVISGKVKRKEEKIDPRLDEKYEKYYDSKDPYKGFERSRERYNKFNSPAIPFDDDDDDIKRAKNGGSGAY